MRYWKCWYIDCGCYRWNRSVRLFILSHSNSEYNSEYMCVVLCLIIAFTMAIFILTKIFFSMVRLCSWLTPSHNCGSIDGLVVLFGGVTTTTGPASQLCTSRIVRTTVPGRKRIPRTATAHFQQHFPPRSPSTRNLLSSSGCQGKKGRADSIVPRKDSRLGWGTIAKQWRPPPFSSCLPFDSTGDRGTAGGWKLNSRESRHSPRTNGRWVQQPTVQSAGRKCDLTQSLLIDWVFCAKLAAFAIRNILWWRGATACKGAWDRAEPREKYSLRDTVTREEQLEIFKIRR